MSGILSIGSQILILFLVNLLAFSTKATPSKKNPKNLILFIGDGMGSTVINATRLQFYGKGGALTIDSFPHTAKVKTSSLETWVTDSAAAATAMATGKKVPNGTLSVVRDSSNEKPSIPAPTLLEIATKAGKKVGLLTTTHITDATPAAFYAHVENRKNTERIVQDLGLSPVNLIMGGGWKDLKSQESLLRKHFAIERNVFSAKKCEGADQKIIGAFADEDLPPAIETNSTGPLTLMKLSELALECLSASKNGFFLMVESEDIDESLHSRNIPQALYAARELDLAIDHTIKWLTRNKLKHNTLILVTADHDTGGLAINDPVPDGGLWTKDNDSGKFNIPLVKSLKSSGTSYPVARLSTDVPGDISLPKAPHTSSDVDLFAMGPGADQIHGTIENTQIFELAVRLFIDPGQKSQLKR
jgi:alkaline phosphatase